MENITTPHWILLLLLMVVNFPFVLIVNQMTKRPGTKKTYDLPPKPAQITREKQNGLITTPVHALLLGLFIATGWIRPDNETVVTVIYSFVITFLWTEIWHYVSHIAMHAKSFHFIHREHHKSMLTGPWTSVSFSFLEKFIFSFGIIGFMAIVSHLIPISVYGIGAYYLLYFYTNTLGHANFEFRKPGYYETFMGKVFNSPSFHAMHHARYINNYGLITPWLDKLFGTAWEDFSEVQTRAANGEPLSQLAEKANS